MSESKISCPHCAQHIVIDDAWAGQTINCPSCQQSFMVPGTPPTAQAIAPPAPAPGLRINPQTAPPPVPSHAAPRPQAPAPAQKTSGLAIASLVLSLLGCFGLFAVAGVICGHISLGRIRGNRALGGAKLATAGLVIGYLMIVLNVVWLGTHAARIGERMRQIEAERSGHPVAPRPAGGAAPVGSGFNVKVESRVPAPADPVSGTVKGEPFTYTRSAIALGTRVLEFDGREVKSDGIIVEIFPHSRPGESLEDRTWRVTPTIPPTTAATIIIIKYKGGVATQDRIMSGYEMELTTGKISGGSRTAMPGLPKGVGGTIAGTLKLKINGVAPVDIKGNFTATVN